MAVYALSDLHLTFQAEKPMDVFGTGWSNYEQRILENWKRTVSPSDEVLMPGDISWGMYLSEAVEDFRFIDNLPGIKYISKGNHDYWWETVTKMNGFLKEHSFNTIRFVYNSAFETEEFVVCATKGYEKETEERLKARELIRLENSLIAGKKLNSTKPIVAMLHYPPFFRNGNLICEIADILKKYDVKYCIYGHIHSANHSCPENEIIDGISYKLVSSDRVDFCPVRLANLKNS